MTRADRHRWQEPDRLAPVILVTAALVAAVLFWPFGKQSKEPGGEESPAVIQDEQNLQENPDELQIQYPVPQQVDKQVSAVPQPHQGNQALPVTEKSNFNFEQEIHNLVDKQKLEDLFLLQNLVSNFVVTIDNMTGPKLPQKFRISKPPAGQFQTVKSGTGVELIDNSNYSRYANYIDLLDKVDINEAVSLYVRYYDMFQQAYRDLGYPDRYFNDRFVQVLEHLLAAPEVRTPIKLVRPKVNYQFADPELERLSAGQKILLRIGPDNAARVKARIRELRHALTTLNKKK